MTTIPVIKYASNEQPADMKSTDENSDEKSDKKLTVLESHGYVLGKTIGAGSYATVKVIVTSFISFQTEFLLVDPKRMSHLDREIQSTQLPSGGENYFEISCA